MNEPINSPAPTSAPGVVTNFKGPSKSGKTTLIANIAQEALKAGQRVVFISMEERASSLVERFFVEDFHGNALSAEKLTIMETTAGLNASELYQMLVGFQKEEALGHIDMLCLDYSNLMAPNNPTDHPAQDLIAIHEDLAALAREMGTHIVTATNVARFSSMVQA